MARDEADLESAIADGGPARMRLYRFAPACITLGRAQPEDAVDRDLAAALGLEVARRPTGGRALLHQDELTYAVVLPPGHPLAAQGIRACYRVVCGALVDALQESGFEAELARVDDDEEIRGGGPRGGARPCFEDHFVESVLVRGLKVCGSAQARRRGAVLQHGTLRLRVDPDREARLLWPARDPALASAVLARRMGGLFDGLPPGGDEDRAARLAAVLSIRLTAAVVVPGDRPGVVSS